MSEDLVPPYLAKPSKSNSPMSGLDRLYANLGWDNESIFPSTPTPTNQAPMITPYAPDAITPEMLSFGQKIATQTGAQLPDVLRAQLETNAMKGPGNGGSIWSQDSMFGDSGWFMPAVAGVKGLYNIYQGNKMMDMTEDYYNDTISLQRDQLADSRQSYNNAYDTKMTARANSMSNELLGISENASATEREAAEQRYVASQAGNKLPSRNA